MNPKYNTKQKRINTLEEILKHFDRETTLLTKWLDEERRAKCGDIVIDEIAKMKRQSQAVQSAIHAQLRRERATSTERVAPAHMQMKTRSFVVQPRNENPKRGR